MKKIFFGSNFGAVLTVNFKIIFTTRIVVCETTLFAFKINGINTFYRKCFKSIFIKNIFNKLVNKKKFKISLFFKPISSYLYFQYYS